MNEPIKYKGRILCRCGDLHDVHVTHNTHLPIVCAECKREIFTVRDDLRDFDDAGVKFNPEFHALNRGKLKNGTWRPKRKQRLCTEDPYELRGPTPQQIANVVAPVRLDSNTRKETHKTPFSLVDFEFVAGMARNLQDGLKNGRERDDWKRLEWTPEVRAQYVDALLRHTVEEFDAFAIACNAMIIAYNDEKMRRQDVDYKD